MGELYSLGGARLAVVDRAARLRTLNVTCTVMADASLSLSDCKRRLCCCPGVATRTPWFAQPLVWCPKPTLTDELELEREETLLPVELPIELAVFGGLEAAASSCGQVLVESRWTSSPQPMQQKRWLAAAAVLNDRLYVVGGSENSKPLASAECFDGRSWHLVAPMELPRCSFGLVSCGDTLIAAGGSTGERMVTASVEQYAAGCWRAHSTLRRPRKRHELVNVQGVLFALGGVDSEDHPLKSVEKFFNGRWINVAPMLHAREWFGAVVHEDHIYVFGSRCLPAASTAERYDPVADRWGFIRELPRPITSPRVVALNGMLLLIGGCTGRKASAAVDIYDPRRYRWLAGPPLPAPRDGHVAACLAPPELSSPEREHRGASQSTRRSRANPQM